MNPNPKKNYIDTIKTGLNRFNTANQAFGGSPFGLTNIASKALDKFGPKSNVQPNIPTANASATSPVSVTQTPPGSAGSSNGQWQTNDGRNFTPVAKTPQPLQNTGGSASSVSSSFSSGGGQPVQTAQQRYNDFLTSINKGKNAIYDKVQAVEFQPGQMESINRAYGGQLDALSRDAQLEQERNKMAEDRRRWEAEMSLKRASARTDGANLTSKQKSQVDSINLVTGQLANYKRLLEENTRSGGGGRLLGSKAAELRSAKAALEFAVAQAAGTGALQAADRAVVMDMIPNPTSFGGALGGAIRGGKQGNLSSVDQAKSIFDAARQTIQGGQEVIPNAVGGNPSGEESFDVNGVVYQLGADGKYYPVQ